MKEKYQNNMVRQAEMLPGLIKGQYEDLEPKVRKAMETPKIFAIQKIVLTGCGDSLFAAEAAKDSFQRLTKLPVEVVEALDLARYYPSGDIGFSPYNPFVIAVSNSGTGARMGEAVERVSKKGGFVLAVTGNEESKLAKYSDALVKLNIPSLPSAPGTGSYLVSLLSLLLIAIRIGEVRARYTMDQAMDYRYELCRQAERLEKMLPEMDASCAAVAEKWAEKRAFEFIASGSHEASAHFGAAKILEATGKYSMFVNSEEFNHLNVFIRDIDSMCTTAFLGKYENGRSRTLETIRSCEALGRSMVVVTDCEDYEAEKATVIRVPSSAYAEIANLSEFVPSAMIAGYIMAIIGEEQGRGCKGVWKITEGGRGVKESEIIIID